MSSVLFWCYFCSEKALMHLWLALNQIGPVADASADVPETNTQMLGL